MRSVAVILIIGSLLGLISCKRENVEAPSGVQLDSRIPPADPDKYKSVIDASNWANPYLVVSQEGVEVMSKTLGPKGKLIPVKDLQKTLLWLPVTAWPYGRIVVVSTPGVLGDNPGLQQQNMYKTEQILNSLRIRMERWPSA
jgi:hypothetical protein